MLKSNWFKSWSEAIEFANTFQRAFGNFDCKDWHLPSKLLILEFSETPTVDGDTVFNTVFDIDTIGCTGFQCGKHHFVPAENGHIAIRFLVRGD